LRRQRFHLVYCEFLLLVSKGNDTCVRDHPGTMQKEAQKMPHSDGVKMANVETRAVAALVLVLEEGSNETNALKTRKLLTPKKARNAKSAVSANPRHVCGT